MGFALGCHIKPRWGAFHLARAPPWYHDIPARIRRSETNPPIGEDPLVWALPTTLPADSFELVRE